MPRGMYDERYLIKRENEWSINVILDLYWSDKIFLSDINEFNLDLDLDQILYTYNMYSDIRWNEYLF